MIAFLLTVSMITIAALSAVLISNNKKLKIVKTILDDVISGNMHRRVLLNNNSKAVADLANSINIILDNMCEIDAEKEKQKNIMTRMISNISHDFKTPLTSLIGYTELIKASQEMGEQELRTYLDVVHSKAQYLNATLENFFYLSRLESEDEKLSIEEINLTDIVKEQLLFFYKDFQALGMEPAIDIPEEDLFVSADKISVKRILHNLISNALKYGKDGNKIGVSLRKDSGFVYVEIWDNGRGIPDKDLPLIFERLYTVEDSRNSKYSGTGIGLSIVKQLVKNNKGTITVKSTPFERTSFTFSLPRVE